MSARCFEKMRRAATTLGWPTRFKEDLLVHDRDALARAGDEPAPFLWCLGVQGTHLLWLHEPSARRAAKMKDVAEAAEAALGGSHEPACWFWWDGYAFHKLGALDRALEVLEQERVTT